jgi:hypothetical protein
MKSCDKNDETIWSHDWTKIEFGIIKRLFPFEIPSGDVDSLVILVNSVTCIFQVDVLFKTRVGVFYQI